MQGVSCCAQPSARIPATRSMRHHMVTSPGMLLLVVVTEHMCTRTTADCMLLLFSSQCATQSNLRPHPSAKAASSLGTDP
jgi:hypothetical protein